MMRGRRARAAIVAVALIAVALLAIVRLWPQPQAHEREDASAVPVSVAAVTARTVPFRLHAIGTIVAQTTVEVKARVDGQIVAARFAEGAHVEAGAVLFEIDPRPYQAALDQAEANLARDRASLKHAGDLETRYHELRAKNFVSRDDYEQTRTNRQTAEATVRADQAAVESARLQLDYCSIRSPIDAVAGRLLIQAGNLVKANDANPLVVLNSVQPVYAAFSVPEQDLAAIRARRADAELSVDATLPNSGLPPVRGKLSFIDNSADPTTGTITLKAEFANADMALWPGQFVDVVLTLYEQPDAIVVPTRAVQNGPEGPYVFRVLPDQSVEVRTIVVDRTEGEDSVVRSGLQPGDQVVTLGQLRLAPGSHIRIEAPKAS